MTHNETILNSTKSWLIRPYVRWYMHQVRHWTVKVVRYNEEEKEEEENLVPKCTQKHYSPAILFSGDGHSMNHYHCFSDVIFPLYMTSFSYKPDVHFLITDYRDILIRKTHEILHRLSRYPIVEIDNENEQVHCYHKMFVGLKFHGDLIVDQSSPEHAAGMSMQSFRRFLRDTYSLERSRALEPRLVKRTSPRLMIVSRKTSRILLNEGEISQMANEIGFDVVTSDAELTTNRSRFAQTVNSCDVMLGVHGAGLTNMLFLPDNAVVIQIVPYGPIDYLAGIEFRDPSWGMNISYLEYKVAVEESSLSKQYAPDDPIITDPNSYYAKGWDALFSVYLHNVNFTIDLGRFKGTLVEAMKLLQH
uniref:GT61_16 n=1 Tax=Plantago cunninghamii TaxID=589140 RepID=A0A1S6EK29_9LAMI|nr:GT61_16 [Plantago cunninghamii]